MMKDNDLDLLLLNVFENVKYVTDTSPPLGIESAVHYYGAVLPAEGAPTLVTPYPGENPMRLRLVVTSKYAYIPCSVVGKEYAKLYAKILQDNTSRKGSGLRIGVDLLTFDIYHELRNMFEGTYVSVCKNMLETRAVKMEEEIKLMREAARVVDVGVTAAQKKLNPGVSEYEVAGAVLNAMAMEGIEQISFWPVAVSGKTPPSSESSGVMTSHRKIGKDDVVIVDHGCFVKGGYAGDIGRVFFLGSGHERTKELYQALYDVMMNGIRKVRPGAYGSEVDEACRSTIKERGFPDPDAEIGHGMGLRGGEFPRITRAKEAKATGTDMKLEPGMIVNLEPIVHVPKSMWMWVENTMLVTESGNEVLTKFPFEPT